MTASKYLMRALHFALIAVSVIVITSAHVRTQPGVAQLFQALMFVECAWVSYRALQMGYLRKTTSEIHRVVGSARVTSGPLEQVAILSGFLAAAVLAFA